MDATRWVPRIGAACAAVMLIALAVPAAHASEVRKVNLGSSDRIHYFDVGAATDRIVVTPDADNDDQFVVFTHQDGTAIESNGNPCDSGGTGVRRCDVFSTFVEILIDAGGGNDEFDLSALPNPAAAPENRDLPSVFNGGSGNDRFVGSRSADVIDGGPGDDHVLGVEGQDRYAGGDGTDTIELAGPGPWTVSLDGVANDGPQSSPVANVLGDVEVLLGGSLGDSFTGAAGVQTLSGRGGNDALDAGPGADVVSGGDGDDTIAARDGAVDDVSCGTGVDTVSADWNDTVAADCETVSRSVRDDDGDGSANGVDCNDGSAAIKPGAGDIPGNGVDEDCDGTDAVLDRDGDGAAAGVDCDDANPARRPGAVDIPANKIDEDCDGKDAKRATVAATFSMGWNVFADGTQITKLEVKGAPRGAKLQVRCQGKGCPFSRKAVKLKNGGAKLTKRFKARRLKPGAVIELRVTAAGAIGKVQRITIRPRKEPKRTSLCLAPGASKPKQCG